MGKHLECTKSNQFALWQPIEQEVIDSVEDYKEVSESELPPYEFEAMSRAEMGLC